MKVSVTSAVSMFGTVIWIRSVYIQHKYKPKNSQTTSKIVLKTFPFAVVLSEVFLSAVFLSTVPLLSAVPFLS